MSLAPSGKWSEKISVKTILGPLIFAAGRGQCITMCNTFRILVFKSLSVLYTQTRLPPPCLFGLNKVCYLSASSYMQIFQYYIIYILLTSNILGIISFSHIFKNLSLSNDGSTLQISVNTSDISVLLNTPPTSTNLL